MVTRTGATQEEVRRHNLSTLLAHVHERGPTSRAELTSLMGLNRSTIGALTADLTASGLVREELPGDRTGAGRPSLVVVPRRESVHVLAIDLGVDHVTVALVGLGGLVLDRVEIRTRTRERPLETVVRGLVRASQRLAAAAPPDTTCVGVGAAVSGVVRREDGLVRFGPNLGWVDQPLGASLAVALQESLGLDVPVFVGNDADLGARAEHRRGVAAGYSDVVYLAGEVGVGGGVIAGGRPLLGHGGYGGEVGHMPVNPDGRRCRCGARGCWETEVGEDALLVPAGRRRGGGRAAVRDVVIAAAAGDQRAAAALDAVAVWLGRGVAAIVNVVNPEMVIFGGLLTEVFPAAEQVIRAEVQRDSLVAALERVQLVVPALGADSTLVGAAELAFEPLLEDPLGPLAHR